MKIKIKKCSKGSYLWYEGKEGEQFEVVEIRKPNNKIREYMVLDENGEKKPVLQQDCRILWVNDLEP